MTSRACASFSRLLPVYICLCLTPVAGSNAAKYSVESDVTARAEYNDNIFLSPLPHDSVYGLIVVPQAKLVAKEKRWETFLKGRLRSNNYSDHNLDSNDLYFDVLGIYKQQRNIYSLEAQYDKDSNLNPLSTDFGLTGRRVNREKWSITPEYTRKLTERAEFLVSYDHTNVDYLDAEGTNYTPYNTDTVEGTLDYRLSERGQLTLVANATDYQSKDANLEFQLYVISAGVGHNFTELWSAHFAIGGSRRETAREILTVPVEFSDNGYVLDAGIRRTMETGEFSGSISRRNEPNSFGGLNEVDRISLDWEQNLSARWRYTIEARYEDIDAVSDITRTTDRELLFFEPRIYYSIDRHWTASASYRYIQRKFKTDTSDSAPHSNRIFIGMTYSFPDISTF